MFIRRTKTASKSDTESYYTYRLVESHRDGSKVKQETLLNLGADFPIPREHWPALVLRVQSLISGQAHGLEPKRAPRFEKQAAGIANRLVQRSAQPASEAKKGEARVAHRVYADSLSTYGVRKAGVEAVGLWALEQLGLARLLRSLSNQPALVNLALASIVMRLSDPGSDRRTHRLLQRSSAVGELIGEDFENQSLQQMYRSSDLLMDHREAIEAALFDRMMELFEQEPAIAFYDLTNPCFEGQAKRQTNARHGKSKEERSDCPLLTLALVLDGSGAIRRSKVFSGRQSEPAALSTMLEDLNVSRESLLVMDHALATEEQLSWLRSSGYRYLIKSRKREQEFDLGQPVLPDRSPEERTRIQRSLSCDGSEAFLRCRSDARAEKERAMVNRQCVRMETMLEKISERLSRPRAHRVPERLAERIGKLKSRNPLVSRYYHVEMVKDEDGKACAISWTRTRPPHSMLAEPGVYSLRTNLVDRGDDWLWETYIRLIGVESVFRSLKSELGLRRISHHRDKRREGHLFISVIAYQAAHLIRTRLKAKGIHHSWERLREELDTVVRCTDRFERTDGRWLHVRHSARLNADQQEIFNALGLSNRIGPITRTIAEADGRIKR